MTTYRTLNELQCKQCRKQCIDVNQLRRHIARHNRITQTGGQDVIKSTRSAHRGITQIVEIRADNYNTDPMLFFNNVRASVIDVIDDSIYNNGVKMHMIATVVFERPEHDYNVEQTAFFHTTTHVVTALTDIDNLVRELENEIIVKIEEYEQLGSGWIFTSFDALEICLTKYNPLNIGKHVKTPAEIKRKNCTTNIASSSENECFVEAVAAAIYRFDLPTTADIESRSHMNSIL